MKLTTWRGQEGLDRHERRLSENSMNWKGEVGTGEGVVGISDFGSGAVLHFDSYGKGECVGHCGGEEVLLVKGLDSSSDSG